MRSSEPFFITGFPRSRTAWLANLFTTDTTLCFHEPNATMTELIAGHPSARVGMSSSLLPLVSVALRDRYPAAPWLFIERDQLESKQSLIRFSKKNVPLLGRDVDRLFAAHKVSSVNLKADPRVLVLPYAHLDIRDEVERAWAHLLPELPFNTARFEILNLLRIEQALEKRLLEKRETALLHLEPGGAP